MDRKQPYSQQDGGVEMPSPVLVATLREHISAVNARIAAAAIRAGRSPEEITLLAVSKTVESDAIRAAIACGMANFGENRVQEYLRKRDELSGLSALGANARLDAGVQATPEEAIRWHFIGRIQTNKARQLAGQPVLLHALDRMALLQELVRLSDKTGCRWQALIEVNVSGEDSKAGVAPKALETLLRAASDSGCVSVLGLMTVAPDVPDPELVRPVFRHLRELAVDIRSWKLDNVVMDHLSMGMSHDLDVAVEEGATIVRVGTAIFGARNRMHEG